MTDFPVSISAIVRRVFGGATIVFGAIGLLLRDDPRWFAASGACGALWLAWDVLRDHVLAPFGEWVHHALSGGITGGPAPNTRPTLEDTIRLLESHIAGEASRGVQINAAIRLEEIYRLIKKDEAKARDVIERVRGRFPDAVELGSYRKQEDL